MPAWTESPYPLPFITGQDVLEQTPTTNREQMQKVREHLISVDTGVDAALDSVNDHEARLNNVDTQISNLGPSFVGPYTWNPGSLAVGVHHLNTYGFVFNGRVGDIWTGHFSLGMADRGGSGGTGIVNVKLSLASGILIANPAQGGITFETDTGDCVDYVSWSWQATQENDYLILDCLYNPYGTADTHFQATAINHGQN